jgi:hypothetical protein
MPDGGYPTTMFCMASTPRDPAAAICTHRQLRVRRRLLALFALPSLLLALQLLFNVSESGPVIRLLTGVLRTANVVAFRWSFGCSPGCSLPTTSRYPAGG